MKRQTKEKKLDMYHKIYEVERQIILIQNEILRKGLNSENEEKLKESIPA